MLQSMGLGRVGHNLATKQQENVKSNIQMPTSKWGFKARMLRWFLVFVLWILVPDQASTLGPQQWEHRTLTTGCWSIQWKFQWNFPMEMKNFQMEFPSNGNSLDGFFFFFFWFMQLYWRKINQLLAELLVDHSSGRAQLLYYHRFQALSIWSVLYTLILRKSLDFSARSHYPLKTPVLQDRKSHFLFCGIFLQSSWDTFLKYSLDDSVSNKLTESFWGSPFLPPPYLFSVLALLITCVTKESL